MPIIGFVYDVLLILLLILKITKLNKENRTNELKRINYLSVIIGCCMWIFFKICYYYFNYFPNSVYGIFIDWPLLWDLREITLLISAIANGILIFKRKKSNKKY